MCVIDALVSRGASIVVGTDNDHPTYLYALIATSASNITAYRVDAQHGVLTGSWSLDATSPYSISITPYLITISLCLSLLRVSSPLVP